MKLTIVFNAPTFYTAIITSRNEPVNFGSAHHISGNFSRIFFFHFSVTLGVMDWSIMKSSFISVNPLNPNSDQHQISPRNISAYATPEFMRIKDMIIKGEFS